MHKFNLSFVFHFYIPKLTSWTGANPLNWTLKFESPSKWDPYEGFIFEHWLQPLWLQDLAWPWCQSEPRKFLGILMPWSHQTYCAVLAVKLMGIMLRNRYWPIIYHTVTLIIEDAHGCLPRTGRCDEPLSQLGRDNPYMGSLEAGV